MPKKGRESTSPQIGHFEFDSVDPDTPKAERALTEGSNYRRR